MEINRPRILAVIDLYSRQVRIGCDIGISAVAHDDAFQRNVFLYKTRAVGSGNHSPQVPEGNCPSLGTSSDTGLRNEAFRIVDRTPLIRERDCEDRLTGRRRTGFPDMATQRFQVVFDFAIRNPVRGFPAFCHGELHFSRKRQRQIGSNLKFFTPLGPSNFGSSRHKFEHRCFPVLFQENRVPDCPRADHKCGHPGKDSIRLVTDGDPSLFLSRIGTVYPDPFRIGRNESRPIVTGSNADVFDTFVYTQQHLPVPTGPDRSGGIVLAAPAPDCQDHQRRKHPWPRPGMSTNPFHKIHSGLFHDYHSPYDSGIRDVPSVSPPD